MSKEPDHKALLKLCESLVTSSQHTTESAVNVKTISKQFDTLAEFQSFKINSALEQTNKINVSLENSVQHVQQANDNLTILLESIIDKTKALSNIQELIVTIKESTDTIDSLAFHSKMLSINATIEAVRIGRAGRGFAVVANEMKKLANTTEESSDEIKETISNAADTINQQIKESLEVAEAGLDNIKDSHLALEELQAIYGTKKGSNNQASMQQLVASFADLTEISTEINESKRLLAKSSDELNNEVEVANGVISDLIGIVKGVPIINIDVSEALAKINASEFILIDVRRDDEYCDELGHIEDTHLLTIGDDFQEKMGSFNKLDRYLFICRSGGRSARAAREAQNMGFENIFNMEGGMLAWSKRGFPAVF